MIVSAVSGRLKDPFSAHIETAAFDPAAGPIYCGRLNAKNSYGGYSGWTAFLVFLEIEPGGAIKSVKPALWLGDGSSAGRGADAEFVSKVCGRRGIP